MANIIEKVLISEEQINESCIRLGKDITNDYKDKELIVVGLLKGCIPFLPDLAKHIDLVFEIHYMVATSYHGTTTASELHIKYDLERPIKGKHVLVVEDIVDSGQTVKTVTNMLKERGAASVEVVTLLNKESNNIMKPKYVGFSIPNDFVVGYGLDYQDKYRNLPYVGIIKKEFYD